jgi:hypothetical protein
MILDFLKSNKDNAYNRRQIAEYLWANYSYCAFKTFDQVLREVGEKLYIHVNNRDTETVQIVQYNTVPYTYQYVGSLQNTKLENYQTVLDFEEESKCIQNTIEEEVVPIQPVEGHISEEQSLLMEDVKAASKINLQYDPDSLRLYLNTVPNKHEVVKEMMQILIEHI